MVHRTSGQDFQVLAGSAGFLMAAYSVGEVAVDSGQVVLVGISSYTLKVPSYIIEVPSYPTKGSQLPTEGSQMCY